MIQVMKKVGHKPEEHFLSMDAPFPIQAIICSDEFFGMDIYHYEDRVEVIDGNITYFARKV